jgi:hypothetical protein
LRARHHISWCWTISYHPYGSCRWCCDAKQSPGGQYVPTSLYAQIHVYFVHVTISWMDSKTNIAQPFRSHLILLTLTCYTP